MDKKISCCRDNGLIAFVTTAISEKMSVSAQKEQTPEEEAGLRISVTFCKDKQDNDEAASTRTAKKENDEEEGTASWELGIGRKNRVPYHERTREECPVRSGAVKSYSVVEAASQALKIHLRRACGIAWHTKRPVICWLDVDPMEILRHKDAIERKSPVLLAGGTLSSFTLKFKELHGKQYVLDAAASHFMMLPHAFWDETGITYDYQDPGIGRECRYLEIDPKKTLMHATRWKLFNYMDPSLKSFLLPYHDRVISNIIKHVFEESEGRKLFGLLYEEEAETSDEEGGTDSVPRAPDTTCGDTCSETLVETIIEGVIKAAKIVDDDTAKTDV